MFGEKADTRAKRDHISVMGGLTFGKNEKAPLAVGEIARESKALQESGLLRQRENIKEA